MDRLWQDIRFGLRMLARKPGFTFVAVVTLALGIGANTAIFSVVHSLLFRPLPVPDAGSLVAVTASHGESLPGELSYLDYQELRKLKDTFSDAVAFALSFGRLKAPGSDTERVMLTIVSGNYFSFLGIRAAHGRTLLPEEAERMGAGNVVVLDHGFWQRRFAGDPAVVGRSVELNGSPFTVVGVAPESFPGTVGMLRMDLYVPLTAGSALDPNLPKLLENRAEALLRVIARLAPGVGLEQARSAAAVLARRLEQEHSATHTGLRLSVFPEPMTRLEPEAASFLPPIAAVFMALVGLVLLIACANVANLLLARASGRVKEVAVRVAVGAGRLRILQQLLTESVLLALLGGAGGLLMAYWATELLGSIRVASDLPIQFDVSPSPAVFVFALLVAGLSGVLAGLVPALQATRGDLVEALKEGGRSASGSRRNRLRSGLVVVQVAVSMVLLIAAGLFAQSVRNVTRMHLGFETQGRLILALDAELAGLGEERGKAFFRDLLERVRALPGVRSASTAVSVPIDLVSYGTNLYAEGRETRPDESPALRYNAVNTDYFLTLGTPIVQGRDFTAQDTESAAGVAIVNEHLAQRLWPGQDPLGRRVSLDSPTGPFLEVVGVAKQGKYNLPGESPQDHVYVPMLQKYHSQQILHVWAQDDPLALAPAIRDEVRRLAPQMPIYNLRTLQTHIREGKGAVLMQLGGGLVGAFGLIGLVLAAIGLYGVVAYVAGQRTHEIGVRMALGATPGRVLSLVLRYGLLRAFVGIGLGLAAALWFTRLLAGLLVGVSATEPGVFAGIALFLGLVAALASYVPARRACRLDPLVALRHE
jgi:predicted permease